MAEGWQIGINAGRRRGIIEAASDRIQEKRNGELD
jgi:hypothetical protein